MKENKVEGLQLNRPQRKVNGILAHVLSLPAHEHALHQQLFPNPLGSGIHIKFIDALLKITHMVSLQHM